MIMKMRASVFAGIALGAVCAVQAQAADLGGGLPYAVANNWAGAYVGGTLGFIDATSTVSENIPYWGNVSLSGSGSQFGIGILAGYNWQSGNQVYGIEADIALPTGYDYFGTLRGRYGIINGNWLVYGTAGLSFAGASSSANWGGYNYSGYSNVGWVAGVGAETKINRNLTGGVEALYYGLLDDTQNVMGYTIKTSVDAFAVRGRVTYRIDGITN